MVWSSLNKTIGSELYQNKLRQPLEKVTGGTLHLFSSTQSSRTFAQSDYDVKLRISAKLTEKGDAELLNQKMWQMDHFLAKYKEIKKFVTQVNGESGSIEVEFTDEYKYGAFPQPYTARFTFSQCERVGETFFTHSCCAPVYAAYWQRFPNHLWL